MKSLHAYFREEARLKRVALAKISPTLGFEEDFVKSKAINDEWNANIAVMREQRLAAQAIKKKAIIEEKLVAADERKKSRFDKIEAIIRKEKVSFILLQWILISLQLSSFLELLVVVNFLFIHFICNNSQIQIKIE